MQHTMNTVLQDFRLLKIVFSFLCFDLLNIQSTSAIIYIVDRRSDNF